MKKIYKKLYFLIHELVLIEKVQYEVRTYTKSMSFERISGSTSDTFLQYIQQNLPEGVSVKVTKVINKLLIL